MLCLGIFPFGIPNNSDQKEAGGRFKSPEVPLLCGQPQGREAGVK